MLESLQRPTQFLLAKSWNPVILSVFLSLFFLDADERFADVFEFAGLCSAAECEDVVARR